MYGHCTLGECPQWVRDAVSEYVRPALAAELQAQCWRCTARTPVVERYTGCTEGGLLCDVVWSGPDEGGRVMVMIGRG